MNDLLQQFSNPNFMPHGYCYLWRPDILWTHVISDLTIGIAYFIIPIILGILLYKREERVPHKDLFALFIAFIFFCGITHFMSIYVTWYPAYQYQGWLKALTAFTSFLTVIVFAPKLSGLIRLQGIDVKYNQVLKDNDSLKQKIIQMNSVYSSSLNREERIIDLKKEVNLLLSELKRQAVYNVE